MWERREGIRKCGGGWNVIETIGQKGKQKTGLEFSKSFHVRRGAIQGRGFHQGQKKEQRLTGTAASLEGVESGVESSGGPGAWRLER